MFNFLRVLLRIFQRRKRRRKRFPDPRQFLEHFFFCVQFALSVSLTGGDCSQLLGVCVFCTCVFVRARVISADQEICPEPGHIA